MPDGIDGKPAIDVFPKPVLPVSVKIGGVEAEVVYAGAAPGFVAGVMQLNVRVPLNVALGNVPVVVTIGGFDSQAEVTLSISEVLE